MPSFFKSCRDPQRDLLAEHTAARHELARLRGKATLLSEVQAANHEQLLRIQELETALAAQERFAVYAERQMESQRSELIRVHREMRRLQEKMLEIKGSVVHALSQLSDVAITRAILETAVYGSVSDDTDCSSGPTGA